MKCNILIWPIIFSYKRFTYIYDKKVEAQLEIILQIYAVRMTKISNIKAVCYICNISYQKFKALHALTFSSCGKLGGSLGPARPTGGLLPLVGSKFIKVDSMFRLFGLFFKLFWLEASLYTVWNFLFKEVFLKFCSWFWNS